MKFKSRFKLSKKRQREIWRIVYIVLSFVSGAAILSGNSYWGGVNISFGLLLVVDVLRKNHKP